MSTWTAICIEGGLLGPDVVERLDSGKLPGQQPRDFGFAGRGLTDEIAAVFADARALWLRFQQRLEQVPDTDPATSPTRDAWMIPFLSLLGYELHYNTRAYETDGATFPISHRAGPAADAPPVHIVGFRQELGRAAAGPHRRSPHALLQEFLNRSEQLWGIVTNGKLLRLLRDCTYVRRQAYIEFDLARIFEDQLFPDFTVLYRLLHRSRLPRSAADARDCWLERYYQLSIEQGGRVRDRLRDGVEECLKILANGFLAHPDNHDLRRHVDPADPSNDRITPERFYHDLLRLVYRFLFLLVSEDRGLISPDPLYRGHYGVARLRRLVDRRDPADDDHQDLWISLRVLWLTLTKPDWAECLQVAPLNGELFAPLLFDGYALTNRRLLDALWHLVYYRDDPSSPPRRVNYAALDVEELGSVYESLLDSHPAIDTSGPIPRFELVAGSERKTTGSYYTPPELVQELIRSALEPVLEQRLQQARRMANGEWRKVPPPLQELFHEYVLGLAGPRRVEAGDEHRPTGVQADSPFAIRPSPESLARIWSETPFAIRYSLFAQAAILSIRVLDPACGSGHFLLAAARRLGKELARLRSGEDEPPPDQVRHAVRDVVTHCIYGVDKNPLAVELCRVALWLEAHCAGKPLTFLDHRIKCGDSLLGVMDLKVLEEGIPDAAFEPLTGDDKTVASQLKKRNRAERRALKSGQLFLPFEPQEVLSHLAETEEEIAAIPDDSPDDVRRKKELYDRHRGDPGHMRLLEACNLWTAAFFQQIARAELPRAITTQVVADHLAGRPHPQALAQANDLAIQHRFFHWPLEFPEVFAKTTSPLATHQSPLTTHHSPSPGFDVVLGNPPWERIKLQEEEFFAARDRRIAAAPTKARRAELIRELPKANPKLYAEYIAALRSAEAASKFLRQSRRFPLAGRGDINTYAVFAEAMRSLISPTGRLGAVLPTGIATDATTQHFFQDLVERQQLASLYDFENRRKLFPAVDSRQKFCLLTLTGTERPARAAEFAFFCHEAADLADPERRFTLAPEDFQLLNPNTRTAPIFRSRRDAELTKHIYRRVPVLVQEGKGEAGNPWQVEFLRMFDMANDSGLFRTREQLEAEGFRLEDNVFVAGGERYLPLYEAKMVHQFDHRFGDYAMQPPGSKDTQLPEVPLERLADPEYRVLPRYWVPETEVHARLSGRWDRGWLLGWRDITNVTNERTVIAAIIPRAGVGHTLPLFLAKVARMPTCLLAAVNSFALDFVARQKVGGTHLTYNYLEQFPILPPDSFARPLPFPYEPDYSPFFIRHSPTVADFLRPRVLELTYTAWDLEPFARDLGYDGPPFRYDPARRALLRAELDALFFHLYLGSEAEWAQEASQELRAFFSTPREAVAYILDQFPIVKRSEEERFGEYRTKRIILEIYDAMTEAQRTGQPWRSNVNPAMNQE